VVTHLDPDMLEYEAEWALESITTEKAKKKKKKKKTKKKKKEKASGDDGIPAELLKILKDAAAKVLHSICQQIWKTQQWPRDWKRSVFIPIPKERNAKECSTIQSCSFHKVAG